jgi:DNA-directed RNA polymerase
MDEKPAKDEQGRFITGNIGGGRTKGARNKLGEAFVADLLADWEENGAAVIEAVRTDKPDQYLKVVASILPKELNVKVSELDELSDEQLERQLASIVAQLAATGIDLIARTEAAEGEKPARSVPTIQ